MSKPYDATTKDLLERFPWAWLSYAGVKVVGNVDVIDANLSTITAEADKVFRLTEPAPYLVHIEAQASRDIRLPHRLRWYNTLLDHRHKLRVRSVVILLDRRADSPNLTGVLDLRLPDGEPVDTFYYKVVRAWEQSIESILEGDPGIWPLAPLAKLPREGVPAVIEMIADRLARQTNSQYSAILIESTLTLAGLRLTGGEISELKRRLPMIRGLERSSYWEVLREEGRTEGEIRGARMMLLRYGRTRLGVPSKKTVRAIESIEDIKQVERLADKLAEVSSWDDLLSES
jgi:hypothetical protein